ncbi:MAG: hypothetical protein MUO23_08615 [Anaerolineales bacterium]|nr:hypothetical protein [Anaerolineales bacterium]
MVLLAAWKILALFAPAAAGLLAAVTPPAPGQPLPETTRPLRDRLSIAGRDAAAFEQCLTDHQAALDATHDSPAGWLATVHTSRQDHEQ